MTEKLFDAFPEPVRIGGLVRPHNYIYIRKGLFYQSGINFDKGAQGHHTERQVQRIQAVGSNSPDSFEDLFGRGNSGAAGAINDADQVQGFIFRILLKHTSALAQISQADDRSAVTILSTIGTGNNADAGHNRVRVFILVDFL